MRSKILPLLMILALIAAFGSTPVFAKASMTRVEGVLQNIHTKTHTLTLQVGSESKSYSFGRNTVFTNGSRQTKALDLKAGEKVSIQADSQNFAHRVEVLQSNPQK